MNVQQFRWRQSGWEPRPPRPNSAAQLVLVFGAAAALGKQTPLQQLLQAYPAACLIGCSTAGEIYDTQVSEQSLVATVVEFAHTRIQGAWAHIPPGGSSFEVGQRLAAQIDPHELVHLFVLSDGLQVNGSELIAGLSQNLPESVTLTGGLSGDGARFEETLVFHNGQSAVGGIAAVGFYGDCLQVGYGSLGGWMPFGPRRQVTKSSGRVVYELDGQPVLSLYKKYLGDYAAGLPATGLLFPLNLHGAGAAPVVRTILSVDEAAQSLTFAGDVPEGSTVQLMRTNFDRLVDGAVTAAQISRQGLAAEPELAVLISCVGRKLVLKQYVEEEVEAVREVMGAATVLTGFYSYGEMAPAAPGKPCELHNQTMTITTFREG